jgi:hypothetical protein
MWHLAGQKDPQIQESINFQEEKRANAKQKENWAQLGNKQTLSHWTLSKMSD